MKIAHLIFLLLLHVFCSQLGAQTTYYVSSRGNDANNGTSPSAPWKTLKQLAPGNTYLLRRGDVFYFRVPQIYNPDPALKITIAAYGKGNLPLLELYTEVGKRAWTKVAANIWRTALKQSTNFSGFTAFNANIGFLKVGGVIYGNRVKRADALRQEWDFYVEEDFLYVYASVPPSSSGPVKFASQGVAIQPSDNMIIRDLAIVGSGGHGVAGVECRNVTLDGLEISEVGGSYLPGFGDGTVRYGNGIEFWNGATNCLIQNCRVSQAYDVAFTMQGIGPTVQFTGVRFQNNFADRNEQSFETWAREGAIGFIDCEFRANKCYNAGYGWSHDVRPDKNQAVHLLSYTWDVQQSDLVVSNNTFHRAKSGLYYHNTDQDLPPYSSFSNWIYLDPNTPIRSLFPEHTIETAEAFVQSTGKEVNSVFDYPTSGEMPVTLEAFDVQPKLNGMLEVSWKTRPGEQQRRTELERSYDGRSFKLLRVLAPEHPSPTGRSFEYDDTPSPDSTVYYRLKQYDADGHRTYSNIIRWKAPTIVAQDLVTFPNPCSSRLTFQLKSTSEKKATISIYDQAGRRLIVQERTLIAGMNMQQIDVAGLNNGVYLFQIYPDAGTPQEIMFFKK